VRYFLPAIAAVLAIAAACSKPGGTGVSVNAAFRSLIPPDTKVLGAADLDNFKNSAFYTRHRDELNIPLLDAMSERIGLDPRRDIADVLIAWNGKDPVVLARGHFKPETLEPRFASLGMRRIRYKSYTLFGDGQNALAFGKHDIAIAGPSTSVRSELDLAASHDGGVPDDLHPLLAAVPKGDQFWAVARGQLPTAEMRLPSEIDSALSNIVDYIGAATIGVGFDDGTHVAAQFICVSDEGAKRVRDALRGGIGLARLTTRDNELDMLRLWDSIQVSQDQQTIRVNADLSASLTDKLLGNLRELRSRAGDVLRDR
jgi:hypothetical protein